MATARVYPRAVLLAARRRWQAGERQTLARDLGLSEKGLYLLAKRHGWRGALYQTRG